MNRKLFKYVTPLLTIIILVGNVIWSQASPAPGIGDAPPPSASGIDVPKSGPETQAAEVVHLFWHTAVGGPAFLSAESIDAQALGLSAEGAQDPKQTAQRFMQVYGSKLQTAQTETQWIPFSTQVDDLGYSHVRLQQTYSGLPVFAGEVVVHAKQGEVNAANGEYLSAIGVSAKPTLSACDSTGPGHRAGQHQAGNL